MKTLKGSLSPFQKKDAGEKKLKQNNDAFSYVFQTGCGEAGDLELTNGAKGKESQPQPGLCNQRMWKQKVFRK